MDHAINISLSLCPGGCRVGICSRKRGAGVLAEQLAAAVGVCDPGLGPRRGPNPLRFCTRA